MKEDYEPTADEIREMEKEQDLESEEKNQDNFEDNQELQESYGYPEADEKQNPSSFLHKAAWGGQDTIRTTFLNQWELGRPLFNIRFLLDMEDVSKHYLDPVLIKLNKPGKIKVMNKIGHYFKMKAYNISDSGMSNEGFAMNLNVTKKMDSTRTRNRDPIENLQGGKKKWNKN